MGLLGGVEGVRRSARPTSLLSNQANVLSPPISSAGASSAVDSFRGLGTWVSIFEALPSYQNAGGTPAITPAGVGQMAAAGVQVLFLQTAGTDGRTSGPLADPAVLASFLRAAHRYGIRVIGWYVPTFSDVRTDLEHLRAIAAFGSGAQRFDGAAVDIEDTSAVTDPAQRSRRLVLLSKELRAAVGPRYPLAAVVLPPVLTEVINPQAWPQFPWRGIAPLYNVWIPMVYWTFRSSGSTYSDPRRYTIDSVTRLRRDLDQASAPVEVLGGVSGVANSSDYIAFIQGASAVHAIGLSVFSYLHLKPNDLALLHESVPPVGFDHPLGIRE